VNKIIVDKPIWVIKHGNIRRKLPVFISNKLKYHGFFVCFIFSLFSPPKSKNRRAEQRARTRVWG
jgi:hypothetical protein